jgi:hypothetical protein
MNGEGYCISLTQGHNLGPRLHPGALFCENELPSLKVCFRIREEYSHLDWENVLSVDVLMKAVIVPLIVLKKQRCRALLAGMMASLNKVAMLVRIMHFDIHGCIPAVRDWSKPTV